MSTIVSILNFSTIVSIYLYILFIYILYIYIYYLFIYIDYFKKLSIENFFSKILLVNLPTYELQE